MQSLEGSSPSSQSLYIAGAWTDCRSGLSFAVQDPATLDVLGMCSDGDAQSARMAVDSAFSAFPSWSATSAEARASLLIQLAQLLERDGDFFSDLLVSESGKPTNDASGEVASAISILRKNAELGPQCTGRVLPSSRSHVRMWTEQQPVGVVAAITPWNYPLNTLCRKIGPALAAGCTIVIKPAPETPLSTIALLRRAAEAGLPPGVVNLVTTSRASEVVQVWLDDPRVRKIAFTGSTAVGKQLFRDSAQTMKRISLELGGHAPVIVFKDADLDLAAEAIISSRFRHAGQTCISAQRVYVEDTAAEILLSLLKEHIAKLVVGNGRDSNVHIGPLINETAFVRILSHLEDAQSHGARICAGGSRVYPGVQNRGFFFEPTLLDGMRPEMRVMQEETFGPVLTLSRFTTEEEVIGAANATAYGLVAYVFTNNLSCSYRMIDKLDFGTVGINTTQVVSPQLPFGGFKDSGVGKENGLEGIDEYLNVKSIVARY